ncbi:uncharacterized protein LOC142922793 isoform X2 [Petromyzon marinus]|uniref:uncharacterized protein LOC142922793 isoform X2 n=1 Tax=Petromyzon marinus TaxID=7757 RepID=UPI003F7213DD
MPGELLQVGDPPEGSRGAVPGTPSPDEARGTARVAVPELTGAAQATAGPRLRAEPQDPTTTVAAGAEGTSSGNDLTVLAPTSSNEVPVAADERHCTQPSCLPHGRPEPSPVTATARENIGVSVLPAPQVGDPPEGSRGAVPGTPSPDEARGTARVAVPELTGAAQAAAGPRLTADPQDPTTTVAAGAEGTSSGNDLTVLAPTSSNEVPVAADERHCTQPSCLPHGRPEPSPVTATARENIGVSVLPAPQVGDPPEGSRGAVPGTPSPDEARGTARVAVPELTGAAQAAAGPRLRAEPQDPTTTVAAGAEGTSSGNDLTVLAPTSSNEVPVAADERHCTQPSCLPHGRPEPSPVPATERHNSVSVLPAPQVGDPPEGSRGAVPGTPSPDEARGTARVAVPELTGAAQAAAGPRLRAEPQEPTTTVACGGEGTSSGKDLTVLAPTSSDEVLVAADEWLCTQPSCLPHGRPEPSPVPATKNIGVSVLPAPQEEDDGIPAARLSLFAPERLSLRWENDVGKGAGLRNLGNTCFLNATLQCLAYTPPLVNYLLLQEHCSTCQQSDFCLMCVMERHIVSTFNNSKRVLTPKAITKNITRIAKHLRIGRQEDAHEFLRYVVDAMQASCLHGHSELDRYTEATTLIYQIFGGYLRSRVECMQCCNHSDTYDTCLDIALHINNSSDLVEAFEEFFNKETLDEYTCRMCCCKGEATKTMALHRLPNVLTVSIKRYNLYGVKINRNITYPEHLDMQPFTSTSQGEPAIYSLYSVLVHKGADSNSGHYYCYNKISDGQWCCMNDSIVRHVDTKAVMNEQAYMLFYIRSPELNAPPADSYCPLEHVKATSRLCLKRPHSAKGDPGPCLCTAALLTGAQETQDVEPPQREQLPEQLQGPRQEQQQKLPATPDKQQPLPLVPEQPPPPRSHSSRCPSTSNHRRSCSSHHHHHRRSRRSRRQHQRSCCHRVSHSSQSNSSQSNSSQSNSSHRHQSHHSHRHSGCTAATTGATTGTRPTNKSRCLKSMIACLTFCFRSNSK